MYGASILWDRSQTHLGMSTFYVDYVYTWVEAIPIRINESRVVTRLPRENIFAQYRMPRAIIGD